MQATLAEPSGTDSRMSYSWQDDGFVVARGLLPRELVEQALAEAIELRNRTDLISTRNLRCRWQTNAVTNECEFETFDPINDLSPACKAIAYHPALISLLANLYGETPALFKDKLIYKPPGCPGYGLHQDWISWPGFPRSFLTVLVPMETTHAGNGCTVVYRGYHQRGPMTPEDGTFRLLEDTQVRPEDAVALELQPGDVAIFGGFVPHRSDVNRSDRWRRQLFLSYNRLSDGGEQRDAHYAEFQSWLRKRYAEHGKTDVYFE
ncbi:MAG: phytanoyl-CoA dioxygenase family protein [Gemmataceae bacterium]